MTTSKTNTIRLIKQTTPRGCDRNVSRQLVLHSADDSVSVEVDDVDDTTFAEVDDEGNDEHPSLISGMIARSPALTND
jgi:hypothetical protein